MGFFVIGSAVICGACGFAALHQVTLWWYSRGQRAQLLFAVCAIQSLIQLSSIIVIATTLDLRVCQVALDVRTINGCLSCVGMVWLYSELSGFPSRRIAWIFTGCMVFVALVNSGGYRFNGVVTGIDRIALPWGEQVSVPIRTAATVWVAPIYSCIFAVELVCLYGAIRLIFHDRLLGALTTLASLTFVATLIVGISTDLFMKKLPYAGAFARLGWLTLMYWSLSRESRLHAQRLTDNEHRLASLFLTSPDAICITRLSDGMIVEANPAFERVFGWTREEAIGHNTVQLGVWQSQSARDDFVAQMRQKGMIRDFDFSFRRKDGTSGFGLVSTSLVDVDNTLCIQVVTRDLTERQRFEEDRRRTERLSSLGLLASGIAHDFNNVLTSILCSSEMIRMSSDEKVKAWADRIIDAGSHARQLSKGLLTFARQSSVKAGVFDAQEAVRTAVTVFGASGRGVDVDLSGLTAPRSCVSGYSASFQSAVLNICLNARDAMPRGGKITISSAIEELDQAACAGLKPYLVAPGQYWELRVADTGVGMDAATLKQCFEPFFTTKGERGTGLGLASVHGAVVEHRGAVRAESTPGNGAVFTFWLPLAVEVMNTQWSLPPTPEFREFTQEYSQTAPLVAASGASKQ